MVEDAVIRRCGYSKQKKRGYRFPPAPRNKTRTIQKPRGGGCSLRTTTERETKGEEGRAFEQLHTFSAPNLTDFATFVQALKQRVPIAQGTERAFFKPSDAMVIEIGRDGQPMPVPYAHSLSEAPHDHTADVLPGGAAIMGAFRRWRRETVSRCKRSLYSRREWYHYGRKSKECLSINTKTVLRPLHFRPNMVCSTASRVLIAEAGGSVRRGLDGVAASSCRVYLNTISLLMKRATCFCEPASVFSTQA